MNIKLPSELKDLTYAQREAVIEEFCKALDVNQPLPKGKSDEHSIWSRNNEEFLAEAEDEFYQTLWAPAWGNMMELIAALGLSDEDIDVEKSFSAEFMEFEDVLIKARDNGQHKISDFIEISKQKRQAFLKYIQGAGSWTKQKLKEIDRILSQKLPDYAKIAEEFAVRAAFIAKIRNKADTDALEITGAFVDRFPKTISTARQDGIVVTQRERNSVLPKPPVPLPPEGIEPAPGTEKYTSTGYVITAEELEAARKEWKKIEVLPLQKQETRAVQQAELRTAEKLSEVSNRHKAAVKQLVLQAMNSRWSAQQLAQALFDQLGDMNRDWRRVAITELAMATNDAYLAGLSEGDQVWVPPVEGACKHCQSFLENKSFTVTHDPRFMGRGYQDEMNYVWVGKSNFGRKPSSWIPCIPLHPNCRHRFHKISRFYKIVDGKPTLKTTTELIQEERARRGMPPDPNLK